MNLWVLWRIGIVLTILTRIAIEKLTYHSYFYDDYYIEDNSKTVQIIMNILAIICIVLVGGIANGKWIGNFYDQERIIDYILVAILPAILTYVVGYFILGLYKFKNHKSQIVFLLVFIVSIIGWSIPICNYNRNYNRNIEIVTETNIESKERNLMLFEGIPVQEISGKVNGSTVFGTGSMSGRVSTQNKIVYWYINENMDGEYATAPPKKSKIRPISDGKEPYVEIITHSKNMRYINHNEETENTYNIEKWTEYIFYLPKDILLSTS